MLQARGEAGTQSTLQFDVAMIEKLLSESASPESMERTYVECA